MILPTKRMSQRALLPLGGRILAALGEPATVSRLWTELRADEADFGPRSGLTYDWFVLALDLLFAIGAIDYSDGRISKTR